MEVVQIPVILGVGVEEDAVERRQLSGLYFLSELRQDVLPATGADTHVCTIHPTVGTNLLQDLRKGKYQSSPKKDV